MLNLVRMAMWQETGGKPYQDLHKRYSPLKQRCESVTGGAATEVGRTQGEAGGSKMLCTRERSGKVRKQ